MDTLLFENVIYSPPAFFVSPGVFEYMIVDVVCSKVSSNQAWWVEILRYGPPLSEWPWVDHEMEARAWNSLYWGYLLALFASSYELLGIYFEGC